MYRGSHLALTLTLLLAGCTEPTTSSRASGPPAGPPEASDVRVLGGWPDPNQQSETTLPWTLEEISVAVALGVVGEPFEYQGRQVLRLTIQEVLHGEELADELLPSDDMPFMGCNPPESIPRPSELFPPGTEVTVYLRRTPAGELQLEQLLSGSLDAESVRGYFAFRARLDGDLAELLPPDTTLGAGHGWALYHAQKLKPAIPQLWAILMRTVREQEPDVIHVNELTTALTRVRGEDVEAVIPAAQLEADLQLLEASPNGSFSGVARTVRRD